MRPRPALDRRLDGALTHRLTCLVATTGYGKSTALTGWGQAVGAVLHRLGPADRDLPTLAGTVAAALSAKVPGLPADLLTAAAAPLGPDADELSKAAALAGALAEALAQRLRRGLVLVFDGIEAIAGAAGPVRYVETLVRAAPRHLHLVTASRAPLPFPTARLRQDHDVLDLDAGDLSLTPDETAAWARALLGEAGADIAAELHRTCGGWPAAVQAALDALAREDPATWRGVVAGLTANSATLERLTLAAFKDLPPAMRELLRAATVLPVLTSGLAATLGAPPDTVDALASRGLFLEPAGPDGHRLTATADAVRGRGHRPRGGRPPRRGPGPPGQERAGAGGRAGQALPGRLDSGAGRAGHARADAAAAGDPAARRDRADEQGDRRPADVVQADGGEPPAGRLRQARRERPYPGGSPAGGVVGLRPA